jgi:peptidoglycan/xylan/chitin deacetylase (PgdA/CDA1 family)
MYFGSVRFFKHLIYTVFFLFIGTLIFGAVFFGIMFFRELDKSRELTERLAGEPLNIPPQTPLSEVLEDLSADGFAPSAMLSAIAQRSPEEFDAYLKYYLESKPGIIDIPGDNTEGTGAGESTEGTGETGANGSGNVAAEPIADTPELVAEVPAYQALYPDLYAEPPAEFVIDTGAAYLTFDDGPTEHTEVILTILEEYDVKATFFFSGGDSEADKRRMKAVADAGHTVGVHSLSHNYTEVYASVESFLEDFYNTYTSVYEATGIKPQIFRFPGGSINNYNRFVYKEIIAEMTRRGFVYYDWNVSGEDAADGATWTSIYNHVLDGAEKHIDDRAIILLHDSKSRTVTVVEDLIMALRDDGFHFEPLTHDIMPVTFTYVS